jgi:Putative MetA-pathway of phenol degradation
MGARFQMARVAVLMTVMGGLAAASAHAQATHTDDATLSQLLPNLLRSTVVLAPNGHEAHFLPTDTDNIYQVPNQFNGALLASLTTFPLGSSSGGFVFVGDPALGDYRPASRSFGPTFTERALTSGKGTINFGLAFQAASFDTFEGKELDDGDIKFYLRHQDCCTPTGAGTFPNPFFEGDLIQTSVSLKINTNTTALLFNYGLTDRWDVGLAVPFVHVNLEADVLATVDPIATGSGFHMFPGGALSRESTMQDSATGIGDVVIRSKYRLADTTGGGLAVGIDLRLPTGNEEELLGLGAPQAKFTLIGSTEAGAFGPHVNLSYAKAGQSNLQGIEIPDEMSYAAGVDIVSCKVTYAFDLIGRTLFDAGRFADTTRTFNLLDKPAATRVEFGRRDGNLNQLLAVAGVKIPLANKLLITANGLFSLKDAGLKANFIPMIGFEYVFPRQ